MKWQSGHARVSLRRFETVKVISSASAFGTSAWYDGGRHEASRAHPAVSISRRLGRLCRVLPCARERRRARRTVSIVQARP